MCVGMQYEYMKEWNLEEKFSDMKAGQYVEGTLKNKELD